VILLAAVLVVIAAVLVVLGANLGGLGWIYGAIATATGSLVALALGVARVVRRDPSPAGDDVSGLHDASGDHEESDPPG
jgi:hypothetical protein